jgi:site-specific DNA-cytosine methylase
VPTTLVSAKRQKEARALAEAGDPSFFVMPDGSVRNASADGQRYKQIGNSWAVDCINWIGARIDKHVRATVEVTIGSKEADALSPWLTCP